MKTRSIRFTATAHGHVRRETAWWVANHDQADVFAVELERAIKIVAMLPGAGTPYAQSSVPGVHRVYLRRIAAHLYYTFDEDEVIIRAPLGRTSRALSAALAITLERFALAISDRWRD